MDQATKRLVKRWMRTAAWRELELDVLEQQPFCVYCDAAGVVQPATLIDHVQPHRGDDDLFWSRHNLQPLCDSCHGRKSQHERLSDEPYRLPGVCFDGTPMASKIASPIGGRKRGGDVPYGGQSAFNRKVSRD